MAIDELLTDNDFWSAYKSPELNALFEPYLIKHNAHPSQKGQHGYNPKNNQWYAEAKEDPKIIGAVKEFVARQEGGQKAKSEVAQSRKSASGPF